MRDGIAAGLTFLLMILILLMISCVGHVTSQDQE